VDAVALAEHCVGSLFAGARDRIPVVYLSERRRPWCADSTVSTRVRMARRGDCHRQQGVRDSSSLEDDESDVSPGV
jgi:hypothetical protein